MIVTTGKHIIIEVCSDLILERRAETPGAVTVKDRNGSIKLPANSEDAEHFINAYRRAILEDIEYKKCGVE